MADYRFSFHEKGKVYAPAWMAPEGWDGRHGLRTFQLASRAFLLQLGVKESVTEN